MADDRRFRDYIEEIRLLGYRMSGSLEHADVLPDEVFRTASLQASPPNSKEREYLYGIAIDRCIEALWDRPPAGLPAWDWVCTQAGDKGQPEDDRHRFLEPFPDGMLPDPVCATSGYSERETISLEFVGALQILEPRARALLLLREVMGLDEVAVSFEHNGDDPTALEKARSDFKSFYDRAGGRREPPLDEEAGALMMRYIHYWEAGDAEGLSRMMADDVLLQSPPLDSWWRGRDEVVRRLESVFQEDGAFETRRLLPCRANGQLAFGSYERPVGGQYYRSHSIHVIYFSGTSIGEIILFRYPSLFPMFGLLPELIAQGE